MDALQLILVTLFAILGAAVQGAIGLGLGTLSGPLLMLVNPEYIPGPILFVTLVLAALIAVRDRSAIDFQGLKWALPPRFLGTLIGGFVLTLISRDQLTLLFGGSVIAAALISSSRLYLQPNAISLSISGLLSGFMGTTANMGGPAMALIYQNAPGKRVRSTISGFFTVATLVSIVTLHYVGYFGWRELYLGLILLPGTLVGYFFSSGMAKVLDKGYTKKSILWFSAISGILVIVKALQN